MKWYLPILGWMLGAVLPLGAETLPPPPKQYFNDYARACRADTVGALNARLEQFERDSSNQVLVVVYPRMASESSIEDFTVRVAESWKVGQKDKDNGAVLFVFINDRKLYLQVGYGLEGVLPDARAKQIIENEIVPRFRQGDVDGGLTAGVEAILASIRGEYTGTGRTVAEGAEAGDRLDGRWVFAFFVIFFGFIVLSNALSAGGRMVTSRGGRTYGGGWSGGGGGFGGGGGGGFSGGGGSFGGGGAGGSW
jgi:uncharacterized protein